MKFMMLAFSAAFLIAAATPTVPSVARHIPLPDGGWDILTVDPESHRVLIGRSNGVDAVDTTTGIVSPHLVSGIRFHGVVVVPGTELAVATQAAGTVLIFNRLTGKLSAELKTDADADALLYEPKTRTVWVMNGDSGTISIVDPVARKSVGKISLGSGLEFAATDGRGHLFVNLSEKGQIAEVDVAKQTVMRTAALPGCQHPTGLAYVRPGVLISACANGVADLTRASDLVAVGNIAIGPRPDGAFADEARHRAYIPSGGDGTLAVIDTSAPLPRKIATVPTEVGARTGTVDPSTGAVYLVGAKFGSPLAGGGRPPILPGSVELLVIR